MTAADQSSGHTSVLQNYLSLPSLNGSIQAEYIWIGGTGQDIRSKTKTLTSEPKSIADLPIWNFDGSSTGQASGDDSEVLLRPVKMVRDPFRPNGKNILVLCDCLNGATADPSKVKFSNRWRAKCIFDHPEAMKEEPWFGMEQEYTLFDAKSSCRRPLGWPDMFGAFPKPQGQYYCGVGSEAAYGRGIAEAHYRCCLYAGLTISGINAEVMPGQWEFQIGPVLGIDAGDQLWLARYMLNRVAEDFGAIVSFEPKPIKGDWNGAGMHTNFSTLSMRSDGGYAKIMEAVDKLGKKHAEHIAVYGKNNDQRLSGLHETAPIDKFSYGVADRGSSIRIPRSTEAEGKGYFEDRRPAANCDPYEVTSIIVETSLALKVDFPVSDASAESGKAVIKDSTLVD